MLYAPYCAVTQNVEVNHLFVRPIIGGDCRDEKVSELDASPWRKAPKLYASRFNEYAGIAYAAYAVCCTDAWRRGNGLSGTRFSGEFSEVSCMEA